MRLGIMQPYFFPYIGHFSLIASVDKWIVFDISQYTKKDWMNRNRILHPKSGWQYITIPVCKASLGTKTYQIEIQDISAARSRVLAQLTHYKAHAPYFSPVYALVESVFKSTASNSLVDLDVSSLMATCEYIGLPFQFDVCSKLDLTIYQDNMGAGDWAPEICRQLKADEYINPASGLHLFNPEQFKKNNTKLYFMHPKLYTYATQPYLYEPNLSILDVLMWNSPQQVLDAVYSRREIFEA